MDIQKGQNLDILKHFPNYNMGKSYIIAEGGNDVGKTFYGSFLVNIYYKGVYRFEDGELIKKIK